MGEEIVDVARPGHEAKEHGEHSQNGAEQPVAQLDQMGNERQFPVFHGLALPDFPGRLLAEIELHLRKDLRLLR